jgi:hypothetical protein
MNLAEDAPWLINRRAAVPKEERDEHGAVERFSEYRSGSLHARYRHGVPTAKAAKTLPVLLGEAQKAGWSREIHIRLAALLQKLHLKDTGPNRKTVRQHLRTWEGAVLEYAGKSHDGIPWCPLRFRPIEEVAPITAGEEKGSLRVRFGERFLEMAKNRDARYIKLDLNVYLSLSSGYSLRLYELMMKNLTFRPPDGDGMIRWRIGAEKLKEKFAVDLPFKEFLRNIRSGIGELERALNKDKQPPGHKIRLRVGNARGGWEKALIYFETDRRLDYREPACQVEALPAEISEESPQDKLVTMIMAEIRRDDPDYPDGWRKEWGRTVDALYKAGRSPETTWIVWRWAREQWKKGSAYHGGLVVNPRHFGAAFDRLVAAANTQQKGTREYLVWSDRELLALKPRFDTAEGIILVRPRIPREYMQRWEALHLTAGNLVRKADGANLLAGPGLARHPVPPADKNSAPRDEGLKKSSDAMQKTAEVGRWEGERKTAKKKAREGSRKEAERSEEKVQERNLGRSREDSPCRASESVKKTAGLLDRILQGDLSPEEGSRIQRIRLLDDIRHAFRHETPLRKEAEEALADYCIAGGFDLPAETSEMRLIAETLAGFRP